MVNKTVVIETLSIGIPLLAIALLIAKQSSHFSSGVYVRSRTDNQRYLVRNNEFKQEAADLLGSLNQRITILLNDLRTATHSIPPNMRDAAERITRLYRPKSLSENVFRKDEHTSYTLNKGQEVALCLRDGADQHFEPINKLMFVLLHEISHVGAKSSSEGKHNREFWDVFAFIYQRAIALGIYKYEDYNTRPQTYCGVGISKTPMRSGAI